MSTRGPRLKWITPPLPVAWLNDNALIAQSRRDSKREGSRLTPSLLGFLAGDPPRSPSSCSRQLPDDRSNDQSRRHFSPGIWEREAHRLFDQRIGSDLGNSPEGFPVVRHAMSATRMGVGAAC